MKARYFKSVIIAVVTSILFASISFNFSAEDQVLYTLDGYTVDGQVLVNIEDLTEDMESLADHRYDSGGDTVFIDYFPGYVHQVNHAGVITDELNASAARDVLRYSAKLDEFNEFQKKAADVDFNGEVNAADARLILRYAARLSGFPVSLKVGQMLYFGDFSDLWELRPVTESSTDFTVELEKNPMEAVEVSEPGDCGWSAVRATAYKPGEYTLEVVYIGYTGEVEQSVLFDVTCVE